MEFQIHRAQKYTQLEEMNISINKRLIPKGKILIHQQYYWTVLLLSHGGNDNFIRIYFDTEPNNIISNKIKLFKIKWNK